MAQLLDQKPPGHWKRDGCCVEVDAQGNQAPANAVKQCLTWKEHNEEEWKSVEALSATGRIYKTPMADSYAMYYIASFRPARLIHVAAGDAWHAPAPLIRGLTSRDLQQHAEAEKRIAELFAAKKEPRAPEPGAAPSITPVEADTPDIEEMSFSERVDAVKAEAHNHFDAWNELDPEERDQQLQALAMRYCPQSENDLIRMLSREPELGRRAAQAGQDIYTCLQDIGASRLYEAAIERRKELAQTRIAGSQAEPGPGLE